MTALVISAASGIGAVQTTASAVTCENQGGSRSPLRIAAATAAGRLWTCSFSNTRRR